MALMFLNGDGMRDGRAHYTIEGVPLLGERRTAPLYRFYSVRDEFPALYPVAEGGQPVLGELYDVPMGPLSALLAERKIADQQLKEEIGSKTADWGVAVISVEIRDVAIPAQLQDAMSRQAQAEREKAARVILASAEQEIAQRFLDAANIYAQNPAALQLRAMNIIYETTKERGSTILIPTAMVDSMNAGNIMGIAAFAAQAPPVAPIAPAPTPAGASAAARSAPPPRGD